MRYTSCYTLVGLIFCAFLFSCSNNETASNSDTNKLFTQIPSSKSGIDFNNKLTENDSLNYFTYAYIYMGGGVSAGDINNDGLIDLFFTGNMVSNKLYLNKGNLEFEDITNKAGVGGDNRWYTGTTMADVNNDGYLDIYCSVGGKYSPKENQLYINNGDNTFTESASKFGIDNKANSVQSTFFDYDLDGDLDLYLANYPPTPFDSPNFHYAMKQKFPLELDTDYLYRNDNGKFVDVTESAGLKTFGLSLSATVGDLNKDGWPDIYISNDFSSPDYMYINNGDGTFDEVVKNSTKNTAFYGMGVDIADFNNDKLLDIIQVDMTANINRRAKANMASMNPNLFWSTVNSGFHYQYMQNTLQLNNGNLLDSIPDFSNIARLSGVSSTDWSWGPLIVDLDNDGLKDIFISNGTRREINNRDYFLEIEKNGVHQDSTLIKTLAIPSEKIDNFVFKNTGDLTFNKVNEEWGIQFKGFSNGGVYVDLDNDGDLEIVTNNIDDTAAIFENKSSEINNWLSIDLRGPEKNKNGLGTKVTLFAANGLQFQELTLTRGFQSSVAPKIHFGLGNTSAVDSILIVWPDKKSEVIKNLGVNTNLTVEYSNAVLIDLKENENRDFLFNTIDHTDIVQHRHTENLFDDFQREILLPHQTSMLGPNVATGDLNGDKLDDIVTGGAAGRLASIYLQKPNGSFSLSKTEAFIEDRLSEDIGIHIFDVENDGDNDIYIVSGGNEFAPNSPALQDRLYLNDGKGNFTKSFTALPNMLTSGSRVYSNDFDKDGDLDLFVGGRLVPGSYPLPANSYLLENVGKDGKPGFVDATQKLAPMMEKRGMITDALWTDFDNDGWTDLVLVGEWMPIVFLKNDGGYFTDVSKKMLTKDTSGWWFSIQEGDFDNDGDMDYIAGNLGLNFKYKANENETFDIFFNDFDKNNTNDIVLSYFNEGEQFPLRGRECSSQQMPAIKKKFENYETFSQATLEDVYTENELDNSLHYQVKSFASVYLENDNGTFNIRQLPNEAQVSSTHKILVEDFDGDGSLDALLAGNLYATEVETPRNDGSNGILLKGNGKGGFTPLKNRDIGLYIPGDVKDMAELTVNGKPVIIVAKNSDYLQFVEKLN
ncbi:VCBS repeat-containing protein [Croceivirga thetidis]|uniref:VCBS repeat-containing protein n=1 Tax=Croceivirga thetidis TaxID=2721623 RepID=A0ABX1GWG8_9FLAO|nr:VCBS repeat-containing protein [Croceivirga thetidis]NKI33310.1 VCBS repeat-containing protein [Croceivirga thetidis]